MRKVISLFAAIALVATAVAAIAGIGSAASGRVAGTKLNLVAYSTPREAYGKLIPAVPEDRGRQGRRLLAVLRRIRRADASGEGGARRRHRRAVARPRHGRARRGGQSRCQVEEAVVQGHGHELRRRLRRSRRQPEAHQELERPDSPRRRDRHAQPVHVGRRALEHHGRLRLVEEAGQDGQAGAGESSEALEERRRPGHERRAAH